MRAPTSSNHVHVQSSRWCCARHITLTSVSCLFNMNEYIERELVGWIWMLIRSNRFHHIFMRIIWNPTKWSTDEEEKNSKIYWKLKTFFAIFSLSLSLLPRDSMQSFCLKRFFLLLFLVFHLSFCILMWLRARMWWDFDQFDTIFSVSKRKKEN